MRGDPSVGMTTGDEALSTQIAPQNAVHAVTGPLRRVLDAFRNWPTSRTAYPIGYIASFDGARGLMTLGVLLAHTRPALFPGAIVYMDVFFVMSGYLITSLLIAERDRRGAIDLGKFYVRRLRRLYPALIAMILMVVAIGMAVSAAHDPRFTEAAVNLAYLMDYWRAFGGSGIHYTGHTWSLAVEEQFYLLWPLAFMGLVRWHGVSRRTVIIVFAAAFGFALWRASLTYAGASGDRLYNSFDTRADALLVGCATAMLLRLVDVSCYPRLRAFLSRALPWIFLYLVVLGFFEINENLSYYYVSPLFGIMPAMIALPAMAHGRRAFMHALLEHPVPVFCGRICYGLYIWHYPVFVLIAENLQPRYICTFLVGWPITFALAIASYYLIERHFMRTRHNDPHPPSARIRDVIAPWATTLRLTRQSAVTDREPLMT